jgi:RND family efflux transporter MFP subunit
MGIFIRVLSIILAITVGGLMTGCGKKQEAKAPPPPTVIVSHPVEKEVTDYLEFSGTTQALQFVQIRARVEGWLDSIHFEPGARMKKGDLLFIIDPRPFKAQVDQFEAMLRGKEAELALKRTNLKRAAELLRTASISQLTYDKTNAEESVAEAQVGIAEANLEKARLDLAYTRVVAPIPGRIGRNMVDVGNLVGAGDKTLLTEMVNDESIYVYFDVNERDLLTLKRANSPIEDDMTVKSLKVPAFLQLADEKGYPHKGLIDYVEPRVDPGTGTLQARAIFPNEKKLLVAGLFGRVRVPRKAHKALLVPDLAVGMSQQGKYVLTVGKDNVVSMRPVTTGALQGSLRVIEKGLAKTDLVVVNGIQMARPGMKVAPKQDEGKTNPAEGDKKKEPSKKTDTQSSKQPSKQPEKKPSGKR